MNYKNLNSSIPADFWEYLEAAGYSYRETCRFHGVFSRGKVDILVSHLEIEIRHNGPADRLKTYVGEIDGPVYKFSGLDHLTLVDFMHLMNITRAVDFREVLKAAGKDQVNELARSILSLLPEDNFLAAPTGQLNERSHD